MSSSIVVQSKAISVSFSFSFIIGSSLILTSVIYSDIFVTISSSSEKSKSRSDNAFLICNSSYSIFFIRHLSNTSHIFCDSISEPFNECENSIIRCAKVTDTNTSADHDLPNLPERPIY